MTTKIVTLAEVLDAAEHDPTPKVRHQYERVTKGGRVSCCFVGGAALALGVTARSLHSALSKLSTEWLNAPDLATQATRANDETSAAKKNIAKAIRKALAPDELAILLVATLR